MYGDEQADAGRNCRTRLAVPNSQARTRTVIFAVQLTTSRIGNLTRMIHTTLAIYVTIHTFRRVQHRSETYSNDSQHLVEGTEVARLRRRFSFVLQQALSFRTRHHLCRQGVALASTRRPHSQGPASVQAHGTGGITGSEGQEGAIGIGGGIEVGGGNGDGNGDVDGQGDGAGAGTGVEANEGAQDGNGDGGGDP